MKLPFTKYQGAGNDFILIDNRDRRYENLNVAQLCHPKFGIGADGLMLLQNTEEYDFEMVYYNSDGNISTMCGNGGRCIVDFAKSLHIFEKDTKFKAIDGGHHAHWYVNKVELQMQNVAKVNALNAAYELNTGSPHYVLFVQDVDAIDVFNEARKIRYNSTYAKEGINVNFVQILSDTTLKVRTYERGVENETLSCGTGVTACAIAYSFHVNAQDGVKKIDIETPGGQLEVQFQVYQGHYENVWLIGPATPVFEGSVSL